MKTCKKCGEYKKAADFYKAGNKDGRLNECIECVKARVRKHRRENDSVREYDRRRYQDNLERRAYIARTSRKWRENNPDRYKAHTALNNAIRDGKMKRGKKCEHCGARNVHIEAHHADYKDPFSVNWLCVRCHRIHHHGKPS